MSAQRIFLFLSVFKWIFALCVLKPLMSFNPINVNLIYVLPTYWLHTHTHTHSYVMKSCDWYDPREACGADRWVSVRKQCCWSQRIQFLEFREECSAVPDVMAQTVEIIPRPQLVQSRMAFNTLHSSCTDVFHFIWLFSTRPLYTCVLAEWWCTAT